MEDWIDNIIAHPLKRRNSYVSVQKALKGRQNIGGAEIPDNGLTKATPPWGGAGVGSVTKSPRSPATVLNIHKIAYS